jgi:hypothetical protein
MPFAAFLVYREGDSRRRIDLTTSRRDLERASSMFAIPPAIRKTRWASPFILLAVLWLAQGLAWSELDTIYLANGQVIKGKVEQITGEYIEYKTTTGATSLVQRIQLASRRDILETNKERKYLGEVKNMGTFIIEMVTAQGTKEIWRMYKKRMIMGIPQEFDENFIESDRQLQAPAKLFPER